MSLTMNTSRQRRWNRRILIITVLILLAPALGFYLYKLFRTPGAALMSHNYTDRPVFSYWVNDNWGGNGGVTCCWRLDGSVAKVVWVLDMTRKQQLEGAVEERHEITIPMPPRKSGDDTLHVYFFPDNRIELIWASTMLSPLHYPNGVPAGDNINEQGSRL